VADGLRRSSIENLAAKLRALAERFRRKVSLRRDPERFYVEKSCICQDLEHMAEMLEHLANEFEERNSPQITVSRSRKDAAQRHRPPFYTSNK